MASYIQVEGWDGDDLVLVLHQESKTGAWLTNKQKWPKRVLQHDLLRLLRSNCRAYEFTYDKFSITRVDASVDDLEIRYKQEHSGGPWYKLIGIQHYKHMGEGFILPGMESHERLAGELIRVMPGLMKRVPYPCTCDIVGGGTVQRVIIHLNDQHHPTMGPLAGDPWDRERIAQWTEELDVDLTVDTSRPPPQRDVGRWGIYMTHAQKTVAAEALLKAMVNIKVSTSGIQEALAEVAASSDEAAASMKGFAANFPVVLDEFDGDKFPFLSDKLQFKPYDKEKP